MGKDASATVQVKHSADEMTGPLAAAVEKFGQHLTEHHAHQAQQHAKHTELMVTALKHAAAPKRIVRDSKGKALGVETVQ